MFREKPNLFDLAAAGIVLLAALLLLFAPWSARGDGETLLVTTPDGTTSYRLSEDREITLHSRGIDLTVEIRDGRARVLESTCPDGVCVSGGWISESGETVLCAPAGVRLTVRGGDGDVDFVAG